MELFKKKKKKATRPPMKGFDEYVNVIRAMGDEDIAEQLEVLNQDIWDEFRRLEPKTNEELHAIVEPRRQKMIEITNRCIKELKET